MRKIIQRFLNKFYMAWLDPSNQRYTGFDKNRKQFIF